MRTLEEPNRHSLHCLVDITRCVESGYEMLLDPESGGTFARAFRLNAKGNEMAIQLARQTGRRGFCTTCTQEIATQEEGFRATVRGFIVPDSGVPMLLNVTQVLSSSVGCGGDMFIPLNTTTEIGAGGDGIDPISLHGGIMVTAWGFMLPTGVLSAALLRHRPNGFWFIVHRVLQTGGFLLAIGGIVVAFRNFGNVYEDAMGPSYRHGVIGLTTMVCGFMQMVAGITRPHAPEEGEEKTTLRMIWEYGHKGLGYSTIVIAYATIYFGAEVAGLHRDAFFRAFYAAVAFFGVAAVAMLVDKFVIYKAPEGEEKGAMTKGEKEDDTPKV